MTCHSPYAQRNNTAPRCSLQVTYDFEKTFMFHEPILAVSAFLLVFLVAMIGVRLDLSIAPRAKKSA